MWLRRGDGHRARRFGPAIAEQSLSLLAKIADFQQLEDLGDQLLLTADGTAWLQVLREASA
ncbi:hypothetical protein [Halochromatium sp.]